MKKYFVCLFCLTLLFCGVKAGFSAVLPAQLDTAAGNGGTWNFGSQGAMNISYRLNEPATSVNVEVFLASDPGTVLQTIAGGTAYGLNTVQWDGSLSGGGSAGAGTYKFRVVAADAIGHGAWTEITPGGLGSEIPSVLYYAPRGVETIKDQSSPYFGHIFVANSWPAASTNPGAEANKQGVYTLNVDMTWTGGTEANSFATAKNDPAAPWIGTDTWSPWKLHAGLQDNCLYLGDWGTLNVSDNIYQYTVANQATPILQINGGNHGREYAIFSNGTGASTVLIGMSRDLDFGGDTSFYELWSWPVGTTTTNYTGAATMLLDAPTTGLGVTAYTIRDVYSDGIDLFYTNQRWNNTETHVFATDLACTTARWNQTGAALGMISGAYPDGITADGNYLYVLGYGDRIVYRMNKATGAVVDSFVYTATGASSGKPVAVDAAGNVITGNNGTEHVRMFAPPDGANNFTTTYYGSFDVSSTSVRDWTLY